MLPTLLVPHPLAASADVQQAIATVVAAPTRRPRRDQPMLIERTVIRSTTLAGPNVGVPLVDKSPTESSPGLEYAALLEASGVDTVKELAQRNGGGRREDAAPRRRVLISPRFNHERMES
jgi:hypothetical protein